MEQKSIKRFAIAGAGNVATHLGRALIDAGLEAELIYSRKHNHAGNLARELKCKATTETEQVRDAEVDIVILAVPDDAIRNLIVDIKGTKAIVVHTSGTTSINVMENSFEAYGVFYPLQSFSRDMQTDFSDIPLCLEASDETVASVLEALASKISDEVRFLNGEKRAYLHLSAVFVNNFANHLLAEAEEICREHDLEFSLLEPLARETVRKAFVYGASKAQTGPARRGDSMVLDRHYEMLGNDPELQQLYSQLATSILKKYHGNFE